MNRLTDRKIVLVKRKTRLEYLIARFNSIQQVQFYIEHMGGDFSDYLREEETYRAAVTRAAACLGELGILQVLDLAYVPNFLFGENDVVVTVGQDGLVANTLKYLQNQPLIGVNPDPARWDGVLLPFQIADLPGVALDVLRQGRKIREVTLAKAELSDGQVLYGVNDLFIGQKTHVSARYLLELGDRAEQQSSSGIIVSTGLGSSGWLKSVLTGAAVISKQADASAPAVRPITLPWDSNELIFSVREPFPSQTTRAGLVFGFITGGVKFRVTSQMPENGVIFSDGIETDFLEFNSGITVEVGVAEKKGRLVV